MLTGLERPIQLDAEITSWDLLPALGVRPELGRGFTPDEEKQGTKVVLISHSLWVSQLGADKNVIGRSLRFSGSPFTIIGVMPPSFRFPLTRPNNALWTTLALDDDPLDANPNVRNRGSHFLNVFGICGQLLRIY